MYKPYTEELFNQPIDKITQLDLERYFLQERDETLFLEFKSFTDKVEDKRSKSVKEAERIRGVLKTIDAFLNSSGGLLIWGAPESVEVERGERKVKMCKGPLAPVPTFYDRDAFINQLASQISPLPHGIRMQPVEVDGGYVYLFEVPESQSKPHQYDGRYYLRMDTRTDVAEHYLVEALFKQIRVPQLKATLYGESASATQTFYRDSLITTNFNLHISVTHEIESEHDLFFCLTTTKGVFQTGRLSDFRKRIGSDGRRLYVENAASIVAHGFNFFCPIEFEFTVGKDFAEKPEIDITVLYGGRNSPSKSQVFRLNYLLGYEAPTYTMQTVRLAPIEEVKAL